MRSAIRAPSGSPERGSGAAPTPSVTVRPCDLDPPTTNAQECWTAHAARLLQRGTDAGLVCFHAVPEPTAQAEIVLLGRVPAPATLRAVLAEYCNYYAARDPRRPELHHASGQRVLHLGSGAQQRSDPATREFCRFMSRCGVRDHAVVFLRHAGRVVGSFGVSRTSEQRALEAVDLRFLRDVQPLLETSYSTLQRIDRAAPSARLLDEAGLSPREQEVAMLIAQGSTNKEIALALSRSPATVGTHAARVFAKLNVRNRTELARLIRS